jgi:hypothetical protein
MEDFKSKQQNEKMEDFKLEYGKMPIKMDHSGMEKLWSF